MQKYHVQISELYQKSISIKATSKEEALIEAERQYDNGVIFINLAEDLTKLNFEIISETQNIQSSLDNTSGNIATCEKGEK